MLKPVMSYCRVEASEQIWRFWFGAVSVRVVRGRSGRSGRSGICMVGFPVCGRRVCLGWYFWNSRGTMFDSMVGNS